jgi:signal transduction histidine kinase
MTSGSTVRIMGHDRHAAPLPDVLLRLDQEYADILALLDGKAATHRIVTGVPEVAGVEVAWVGERAGKDEIVLQHMVNAITNGVNGLVVPLGTGLGGKVLAARRPMWVADYCRSEEISHHFKGTAAAEQVRAMIAVPIIHNDELLGVLYGAHRGESLIGDRTTQAMERIAARVAGAAVVAERARHKAEVAAYEERRRVALELHDTVGAVLFTLRAGIQRLGDEPNLDDVVRARLTTIGQQAAEASEALRGSLQALNAPPEEVALGVALRGHCRAFEERTGIAARLITLTNMPALSRPRITALSDATREGLLNVEKHARASSVVVTAFSHRNGVAVTVSDDGIGLDDGFAHRDGLGLPSMSERLARMGGTITIGPNEDGGVILQAWLPR